MPAATPIDLRMFSGFTGSGTTTASLKPKAFLSSPSNSKQSVTSPSIQIFTSRCLIASLMLRTTVTRPMPSRSAISFWVRPST